MRWKVSESWKAWESFYSSETDFTLIGEALQAIVCILHDLIEEMSRLRLWKLSFSVIESMGLVIGYYYGNVEEMLTIGQTVAEPRAIPFRKKRYLV